jgi:hypothetical protein
LYKVGKMNFEFTLPISIPVSKNKSFTLNLNQYRNTYFRDLANAKVNFKKWFCDIYGYNKSKPLEVCKLEYVIYFRDNRKTDIANVGSIVDKFASDCLVDFNYIRDDNRKVVKAVSYFDGGIDKPNPRVLLFVKELIDLKNLIIV